MDSPTDCLENMLFKQPMKEQVSVQLFGQISKLRPKLPGYLVVQLNSVGKGKCAFQINKYL